MRPGGGDIDIDTSDGTGGVTIGESSVLDVSNSANEEDGGGIVIATGGGSVVVDGTLRANGGSNGGWGGTIDIGTPGQGTIGIGPGAELIALGTNEGDDGGIVLGPACAIDIDGFLDTHRTGYAGVNELLYRSSLTISGDLEAGPAGNVARCRNVGGQCENPPSVLGTVNPPLAVPTLTPYGPCTGCGNDILDPLEQCDDGDVEDGDSCAADCRLCPNSTVNAGEQCDDGNRVDGDGCAGNCMLCGSGTLNAGEQCDDGDRQDGDGCDSNCTPTGCGNGVITGTEQCDDANVTAGDGCSPTCMAELTFSVNSVVPGKDATQPAIARAPNNTFAIVWKDQRSTECAGEIRGNVYANGAYGVIPGLISADHLPVTCSPFSGDNYYPAVSADASSRFVVSWRRSDGTWLGLLQQSAVYHLLASGYPVAGPLPVLESPTPGAWSFFQVATFLWSPAHTILGNIAVDFSSPPFMGRLLG